MYKKKDFIEQPVKEDLKIWDSIDKKYYISTALIEGATFFLYEFFDNPTHTTARWEQIYEGVTFEDCLNFLNCE